MVRHHKSTVKDFDDNDKEVDYYVAQCKQLPKVAIWCPDYDDIMMTMRRALMKYYESGKDDSQLARPPLYLHIKEAATPLEFVLNDDNKTGIDDPRLIG